MSHGVYQEGDRVKITCPPPDTSNSYTPEEAREFAEAILEAAESASEE